MRLILLRHASAEARGPEGADHRERRLTRKGQEQISGLSRLLDSADIRRPARLISSPYQRCLETASEVRKALSWKVELEQDPRLAPETGTEAILSLIADSASADPLWLVGHEPDLSNLASLITAGRPLKLRKCGLIEIELDSIEPPRGQLLSLLRPAFFPKVD